MMAKLTHYDVTECSAKKGSAGRKTYDDDVWGSALYTIIRKS